ncbi:Glycosyltransferase involved in cell wall bisynthesis [Methylobacterium sp. UNC300MFChir4.1]|uniref:hypothetical protein n=1 Tax=Methylobacterium sp. UNC300MFChir4.1 TaxID=1502747 RepID=UPI0008B2FA39|nr:hypothetical protein [Methylobacterium sp. UNC300MFChir4.1]SEP41125.1 Glycosyltransferase involved in cell wall bisynthesis [Methylobacterium sp. UNC300MFChir4.1]
MASICFVTDEVMPFTMGGIGAFIRNTIDFYSDRDDIIILYTGTKSIPREDWKKRYDRVELFPLYDFYDIKRDKWERQNFEHPFMKRSMIIKECLIEILKFRKIDYIEFVDWGGLGFYTQQAKLAQLAFRNTKIAVRIHTTDGILRHFEGRNPGYHTCLLSDFERKALADADIVVGHLEPVAKFVSNFYGFAKWWTDLLEFSTPAVQVQRRAISPKTPSPDTTNILFTSKFQAVKRPETFIQGACLFLETCSWYKGKVILTAMEPVGGWSDRLKSQIPSNFRNRFIFLSDLRQDDRAEMIASSVAVFPNSYEAFCFAAYEASMAGAVCVLNEQNVAFGASTPWIDGFNCVKFDGSAFGLAIQLERIFLQKVVISQTVIVSADENPYWRHAVAPEGISAPSILYAAIVFIEKLQITSIRTLFDFFSSEQEVSEVVIVLRDAGVVDGDPLVDKLIEMSAADDRIRIIRYESYFNRGTLLNEALRNLRSDFFVYVPAGAEIVPGFSAAAVTALACNNNFDVVLPISSVTRDGDDLSDAPVFTFFPVGEGLSTNMIKNRTAAHCFVARSSVVRKHMFDENIPTYHEWELLTRLAGEGIRMICWPEISVGYPENVAALLAPQDTIERNSSATKIRENINWSCKGGSGSLVIIDDAVGDVYDGLQVSSLAQSHVSSSSLQLTNFGANQEIEIDPAAITLDKLASIYDKSIGDLRRSMKRRILDIPRQRRKRLYVHLDSVGNYSADLNNVKLERGHDLDVIGWWRTDMPILKNHHLKVIAVRDGIPHEMNTSIYRRIDVAVTHHLPTSMKLGFTAQLSSSLLLRGKYDVVARLYVESEMFAERTISSVHVD